MKVNLVVASGVHQGRIIPIPGQQFLVGRDPHCQLRPASPAISKQHAAILIRDAKVFVKDFGSTNGTFVNDEAVAPETEHELRMGDRLKMGPLDFTIQIVLPKTSTSDSTPLPDTLKPLGTESAAKSAPASKAPAVKPESIPGPKTGEDEDAAALLLGLDDDDGEGGERGVPEGSTVMDIPATNASGGGAADPKGKKNTPSKEDTSNAANEILRKYMRRPK